MVKVLALDDSGNSYVIGSLQAAPAFGSTTISFALPKAANVTLKIYNMRGQLVQTLGQRAIQRRAAPGGMERQGRQRRVSVPAENRSCCPEQKDVADEVKLNARVLQRILQNSFFLIYSMVIHPFPKRTK